MNLDNKLRFYRVVIVLADPAVSCDGWEDVDCGWCEGGCCLAVSEQLCTPRATVEVSNCDWDKGYVYTGVWTMGGEASTALLWTSPLPSCEDKKREREVPDTVVWPCSLLLTKRREPQILVTSRGTPDWMSDHNTVLCVRCTHVGHWLPRWGKVDVWTPTSRDQQNPGRRLRGQCYCLHIFMYRGQTSKLLQLFCYSLLSKHQAPAICNFMLVCIFGCPTFCSSIHCCSPPSHCPSDVSTCWQSRVSRRGTRCPPSCLPWGRWPITTATASTSLSWRPWDALVKTAAADCLTMLSQYLGHVIL